jgi:Holliday junction resolvase RusA-like endonuclease
MVDSTVNDPVTIVLLGAPVPSAQGSRGKSGHRFVPKRQSEAVAFIRAAASDAMINRPMLEGALRIEFLAEVPIPKTFSKRKREAAIRREILPTKKPDLKNLAGLAEDALKTVVFADDSVVCEHHNRKVYGLQPKIVVTVTAALQQ